MLKNEREKYEKFFKSFGLQLKYGVYEGFGANKELLEDLLLFYSSTEKKLVTLDEYRARMKEDQKYIFFASGSDVNAIDNLPQAEFVKEKGYEILYLTENVDEFTLQMMREYDGKEFKSVSAGDLNLDSEEEKKKLEEENKENKDLFDYIKESLDGKVTSVKLSSRLKTHPVCITSEGNVSLEMEKVLSSMPNADNAPKAEKILEINSEHPIYEKLKLLFDTDKELLKDYSKILYGQALLIEGMAIDNPVELSDLMSKVLSK